MYTKLLAVALAVSVSLFSVSFALASSAVTLEGGAVYAEGNESGRSVELTSSADSPYGSVDYALEGSLMFAELTHLSTDYLIAEGDVCAGGSPRFQINVSDGATTKNIFAYFGSYPSYDDCVAGTWTNTGDVLEAGLYVDTSQLPGGTFYDTYESAVADFGAYVVTGIQVVADGSWAVEDGQQVVTIDNTVINTTTVDYEIPQPTSKDQCKKGGWQYLADDEGNSFKNQGQCVSYFAKNKNN